MAHRSPYADAPLAVAQALVAGRQAGDRDDADGVRCPYPGGSHEHDAWHRGFRLAHALKATAR